MRSSPKPTERNWKCRRVIVGWRVVTSEARIRRIRLAISLICSIHFWANWLANWCSHLESSLAAIPVFNRNSQYNSRFDAGSPTRFLRPFGYLLKFRMHFDLLTSIYTFIYIFTSFQISVSCFWGERDGWERMGMGVRAWPKAKPVCHLSTCRQSKMRSRKSFTNNNSFQMIPKKKQQESKERKY